MTTNVITVVVSDEGVPADWPRPSNKGEELSDALFEFMKSRGLVISATEVKPVTETADVVAGRIIEKWASGDSISTVAAATNEHPVSTVVDTAEGIQV